MLEICCTDNATPQAETLEFYLNTIPGSLKNLITHMAVLSGACVTDGETCVPIQSRDRFLIMRRLCTLWSNTLSACNFSYLLTWIQMPERECRLQRRGRERAEIMLSEADPWDYASQPSLCILLSLHTVFLGNKFMKHCYKNRVCSGSLSLDDYIVQTFSLNCIYSSISTSTNFKVCT